MVVCLAVLQLKSLADLYELQLTVAAMKRNEDHNFEKDLDKNGRDRKMLRNAVYGKDIQSLRVSLKDRGMTILELQSTRFAFHMSQYGAPTQTAWRIMHLLYGAEYHDHTLFKLTNAEGLLYHNIPCVVCRSRLRITTFMLPARNRCFGDWHVEYHGYLMTVNTAQKASTDYICVDEAPEEDPSGYRTEYCRLLYRVEAICGSLPCPQYMQGRELTCATCSK
ncbi:hypothetical protein CHS0354_015198 [Potamilus streckersoni]|uniref:Uncharacterized protein n=1 Tax=Potamilus streckersoni TaxID=2493646 RepID=A0AAE0SD18_9BIVA|nr:hypothetical protein CHS0354_015198 [Potamilus streckersoni]